MTTKIVLFMPLALLSLVAFAKKPALPAQPPHMTILFVCEGNIGRSFMAEWITRNKYSDQFFSFSRGSGIDPGDDVYAEVFARDVLAEFPQKNKPYASYTETQYHRATPLSVIDLYNANATFFMDPKHHIKALGAIERDCNEANWPALNIVTGGRNIKAWDAMCSSDGKAMLMAKMYNFVDCAQGTLPGKGVGKIETRYGHSKDDYVKLKNELVTTIDTIVQNYRETGVWCKLPPSLKKN